MKQDISLIDPNFLARSPLTTEFDWYDITRAPMEIRGLALHQGDMFCRLPKELLPQMSEGVQALSYHTAGGRVRFRTNAPKIALRVCSRYANMMSHMPLTGSAGVDVYINGRFQGSVRPSGDRAGWYEGVVLDPYIPQPGAPAGSVYPGAREGLQDVEINLPLYNGLTHMLVGIPKGCTPEPPRPYALDTPIV